MTDCANVPGLKKWWTAFSEFMNAFKLLIARHSLDGCRRPRAGLDTLSKICVCILALFSFGLPSVVEYVFDSDSVEQVEFDSDDATATRWRNASRRRVLTQGTLTNVLRLSWIVADRLSGRLSHLNDVVVPHDFDLRNGLGANLRC